MNNDTMIVTENGSKYGHILYVYMHIVCTIYFSKINAYKIGIGLK